MCILNYFKFPTQTIIFKTVFNFESQNNLLGRTIFKMSQKYLVDIRPAIDYMVEYYKNQHKPSSAIYGTFEGVCQLYGNFASVTHLQDFFNDFQTAKLKKQKLLKKNRENKDTLRITVDTSEM
jgi:hypothetical protein